MLYKKVLLVNVCGWICVISFLIIVCSLGEYFFIFSLLMKILGCKGLGCLKCLVKSFLFLNLYLLYVW